MTEIMGMFDTIHLKNPLACQVCGNKSLLQTHAPEDIMANYPDRSER